jgi:1,4-alpha-glucan branching enzyme
MLRNIYLLFVFALACSKDEPVKNDHDELKQYGTPYALVPDPQNVILYEVNIRAFSSSGDLQGVIDSLDHIKDLGVNTIWLMPVHPVGQERSAGGLGSPYSVRDHLAVNPELGDLQKLRDLVQGAHEREMAVIMDWVANHTSWDHEWMENKSWYTQDANGNVIVPPGTNWQDVAELNYNNQDMRKAMIHAMKYWVLEANVDGFRCDAVDFVPADFWKQALDTLKSIAGRKLILLAEGGKAENFAAGFQMNYAWDFYNNMKAVYDGTSANSIFTTHLSEYNSIPQGAVKLRYTTNHDQSAWEATPVETFGGTDAALSASVITIFTSAAPLLYSSQEVGRAEKLAFFTRDPIDWNSNPEMLQRYKRILATYQESEAFTLGALANYAHDDLAVFTRTSGDDRYLIIVNVRNTDTSWTVDQAVKNETWINTDDANVFTMTESITLAPFGYLILKKQ